MEAASIYLPMDRRQALAQDAALPERTQGAALFADISGFTPLTEALARELGPRLGAEELTTHLNRVYDALIAELHRYGGSVISFSGDAITCWLDGDDGSRATDCALAMQQAMAQFAVVTTSSGTTVSLGMKATVATGPVCRFQVGDPGHCMLDAMTGETLARLAAAEQLAQRGEVVVAPETAAILGEQIHIQEWRENEETGARFAVVTGLAGEIPEAPWSPLPPVALSAEQVRPWLLPPVFRRLQSGQGEFLAELRPVAALFLRFEGIDYDRDPEAGDKLDLFVRQVEAILGRYDGSLLNLTIGDKGSYLYAAFGAPIAHEDDAARAVSAALELQALGARLEYLSELQIGITRGRMRTGAYGSRTRRTYSALGDEVNLAARLMLAAEPGQILASERVRNAGGDAFIWEGLPPLRVKGKREPVSVALLVGSRKRQALHLLEPRYALPMVGRRAELALIEEKVEQVLQGQGQIVGITAEAGMGKSRLAVEAIGLAEEKGLVGYGGECQSYGTTTSYLVWRSVWRGLFGLDPAAPLEDQVRSLEATLRQIDPGLLSRLPLLGAVLNIPIPDNDLTRSLEAKVRKSSLEALLVDCLRAWAGEYPLLLVLEDCHWLDPLSRDLIEEVGRALADRSVLLLLVYRPWDVLGVPAPKVDGLPHFIEAVLTEFTPQEAERLIQLKLDEFFGSEVDAPRAFVAQITDRADGNPFYIEELLNYLQGRGIHPRDSEALAAVDLPSSLYSLVLSRMDQLTESQQTAMKVASVIGRLFQAAMVWGVYPQLGSFEAVKADLEALSALELAPLHTPEPELTYLFKHIITQEVAYESLLFATRATLHEQIGRYIERTHAETLDQYLNLLAFHYERSEDGAKKREYLLRAGEAAKADYANAAAIEYYEKVLPLLPDDVQVEVLRKLGDVLELTGEWDRAGERYREALALAEGTGNWLELAQCETRMAVLHQMRRQHESAMAWVERARTRFEELGDEAGVGSILIVAGTVADQQGDSETAQAVWQQGLDIYRRLDEKPHIGALLSNLGIAAARQGDLDSARDLLKQSLAVRRAIGDPGAIAISLQNIGTLAMMQGRIEEALPLIEEALALQREVGDRWMIGNALHGLGNAAQAQGDYGEARSLYGESLSIYRVLGDKYAMAYLFEDVGCLAGLEGEAQRALRLVGAASALRDEIGGPLTPSEMDNLETALEPAREALSEERQQAAWSEGQAMSLEEAVECARANEASD
jgi:predicted ATPase/class 3 adenylate cyclase